MRGISPIVAVVLLIAISVIATVGVYYWIGSLTGKKATPNYKGQLLVRKGYELPAVEVKDEESM